MKLKNVPKFTHFISVGSLKFKLLILTRIPNQVYHFKIWTKSTKDIYKWHLNKKCGLTFEHFYLFHHIIEITVNYQKWTWSSPSWKSKGWATADLGVHSRVLLKTNLPQLEGLRVKIAKLFVRRFYIDFLLFLWHIKLFRTALSCT